VSIRGEYPINLSTCTRVRHPHILYCNTNTFFKSTCKHSCIATAVANRLAPSILQLDALASIAAHCPHEAMKALRFVFAAKPEFLAGCVPPGEASAEFLRPSALP
jgi:hypothetical protein